MAHEVDQLYQWSSFNERCKVLEVYTTRSIGVVDGFECPDVLELIIVRLDICVKPKTTKKVLTLQLKGDVMGAGEFDVTCSASALLQAKGQSRNGNVLIIEVVERKKTLRDSDRDQ